MLTVNPKTFLNKYMGSDYTFRGLMIMLGGAGKGSVYSDEGLQDNKICKKCTHEVRESS